MKRHLRETEEGLDGQCGRDAQLVSRTDSPRHRQQHQGELTGDDAVDICSTITLWYKE